MKQKWEKELIELLKGWAELHEKPGFYLDIIPLEVRFRPFIAKQIKLAKKEVVEEIIVALDLFTGPQAVEILNKLNNKYDKTR